MPKVIFGAVLHQPFRIRRFTFLEIGKHKDYFDNSLNGRIFRRVARKSYLPTLKLMKDLVEDDGFKVNLSFTGTFFEQALKYRKKVIEALKELYSTGGLELIAETYYHSLAFLVSRQEFEEQVKMHVSLLEKEFGAKPNFFRNTEAMYSDDVAKAVEALGFKGIITEGSEKFLGWRNPNWVYQADDTNLVLLCRNYRLSDDIAFRFSARGWEEWPLTADKYAAWLAAIPDPIVLIYIDFETFGEHHWPESGIFEFLKWLPKELNKWSSASWANISETLQMKPVDKLSVPFFVSWADMDRDLSAWLGNKMQQAAFNAYKKLEPLAKKAGGEYLEIWRKLGTSDHFYYMSTKWHAGDEEVHSYFRGEAYSSPYEAFTNYMNILQDFKLLLQEVLSDES